MCHGVAILRIKLTGSGARQVDAGAAGRPAGVAEGEADGAPCIVVFVASDAQPPPQLPAVIEGYLVVVRRTGAFRPQPLPPR